MIEGKEPVLDSSTAVEHGQRGKELHEPRDKFKESSDLPAETMLTDGFRLGR